MHKILIISSSIREGRKSDRVARYFLNYISDNKLGEAEIADLDRYNFPIFTERRKNLKDIPPGLQEFTDRINNADGIIIVTPEYNGGYPASLKNAIDVLYEEWHRKPIAISTVSNGAFGGSQVLVALQFSLFKIRAWTVPALFPVPNIDSSFNEDAVPADKEKTDKRAAGFINELTWCMDAKAKMNELLK